MSISRTDLSGSVIHEVVKKDITKRAVKKVATKGLKKVVKKKHARKKKAAIGTISNKKVAAQQVLTMSKPEERPGFNPANVSVKEVEVVVSNYREHTRSKLARDFPMIVDSMLAAAKTGRLTDTKLKLLLHLAGVNEDPQGLASRKSGPSLGKLLLDEIKQRRKAALEAARETMPKYPATAIETGAMLVVNSSVLESVAM